MSRFPGWYQISDDHDAFPPRKFMTAEQVPPGWVRCKKQYDEEVGQWVKDDPLDHDGDGRKGGSLPDVDPLDLPAIAGFVTHGFDRDDAEHGNPPRPQATVEPADKVVPSGKPEADTKAAAKPKRRRGKKRG